MLLNYIKLALRLMGRNPFFTFINVVGLAIGLASFFALWEYATSELQANQFLKDHERVARLGMYWRYTDNGQDWEEIVFGFSKSDMPDRLKADYPEIESFVRILMPAGFDGQMVPHDENVSLSTINTGMDEVFKETNLVYADSNLFSFFSIPLTYGLPGNVLNEAGSVVLSESKSHRYFGNQNPIGKTLKLNDSLTLKVTGVFRDLPHNTHFEFDVVVSNMPYLTAWANAYFGITQNYFKLREGASIGKLEDNINVNRDKYLDVILEDKTKNNSVMFFQALADIPFESHEADRFYKRSKTLLVTLTSIAVVILLMAWGNYVNMSIAIASKRMKEFAARKVNGALSWNLIQQSTVESAIINLLALLLAFTLLQFVRQPAKAFFNIHVPEIQNVSTDTLVIFGVTLLGGIFFTGLYTGMTGASHKPRTLLQLHTKTSSRRVVPSVLTIMQLTAAVTLMMWAFVVFLELDFILNKEIGLNRENVLVVEAPFRKSKRFLEDIQYLANNLTEHTAIEDVTFSKLATGDFIGPGKSLRRVGSNVSFGFDPNGVNENYIPFYGLKLIAGRNFVKDESGLVAIISGGASSTLGFARPDDALGTRVETNLNFGGTEMTTVEVIGVIEDFRTLDFFSSTAGRSDMERTGVSRGSVLTYRNSVYPDYLPEKIELRVKSENLGLALSHAEAEFRKIFPGSPFTWYFLDDHINSVYTGEKIARNQILLFTVTAIVIACLGLTGLTTHRALEKVREIGIRKVLGAGVSDILQILISNMVGQFVLAIFFGIPLAWFLGQQYLEKFSEKVPLAWWHYLLPVMILLSIIILSISSILFRAWKNNPVEALKCE